MKLLFLVVCLFVVCNADICTGPWSFMYLKCWESCPLRENGLMMLNSTLQNRIYGQEYAIDKIVNALLSKDPQKCISFHFSGDNGVGKTITALTITEALFCVKNYMTDMYRGLLYLRGNKYRIQNEKDTYKALEYKEEILNDIYNQLSSCPHSVIILDEAELPDEQTMEVFEEILDEQPMLQFKKKQTSKKDAIFIFISDFGMLENKSPKTIEKIQNLIYTDTKNSWIHSKHTDLIQYIIPFVPLSIQQDLPQSILKQVAYLIKNQIYNPPSIIRQQLNIQIKDIEYTTDTLYNAAILLYNQLKQSDEFKQRNYRGIEQLFTKQFNLALTQSLDNYKNKHVILSLSVENEIIYQIKEFI